jgi:hypothetical protein
VIEFEAIRVSRHVGRDEVAAWRERRILSFSFSFSFSFSLSFPFSFAFIVAGAGRGAASLVDAKGQRVGAVVVVATGELSAAEGAGRQHRKDDGPPQQNEAVVQRQRGGLSVHARSLREDNSRRGITTARLTWGAPRDGSHSASAAVAYLQAHAVVRPLIEAKGAHTVFSLIKRLNAGDAFADAFRLTYFTTEAAHFAETCRPR